MHTSKDQASRRLGVGAAVATAGAFPAAALIALVYGFPVPFVGKLQGVAAIKPAMFAVVFYGILGGFIVLPLLGAAAGFLASRMNHGNPRAARRLTIIAALAVSLACVVFLATLDLLIGPW